MHKRCVQWVEMDGKRRHLVAGKLNYAVGNPTFDPISKPGRAARVLPGNPGGQDLRRADPLRARADAARVHGPRRARRPGRRAGARRRLALPDGGRPVRAGDVPRHRGPLRAHRGLQPLARGGLGAHLQGQALRRALPDPGRRGLGVSRARVGARAGRAGARDAALADPHPRRLALALRRALRSLLGAGQRGGDHRGGPRREHRVHGERLRRQLGPRRARAGGGSRAWPA